MVVLVHLPQDTERTIIPYLNKKETLEGLLNDEYCTWIYEKAFRDLGSGLKGRSVARRVLFYQDELGEFKNSISSSEDTLFKTLFL